MKATSFTVSEKPLEALDSAAPEGAGTLRAMASVRNERIHHLRARMRAAMERSRALCHRLEDRTVAAAKATDTAVRHHPYQAMGIAFGVGLLIGALAMRARGR